MDGVWGRRLRMGTCPRHERRPGLSPSHARRTVSGHVRLARTIVLFTSFLTTTFPVPLTTHDPSPHPSHAILFPLLIMQCCSHFFLFSLSRFFCAFRNILFWGFGDRRLDRLLF